MELINEELVDALRKPLLILQRIPFVIIIAAIWLFVDILRRRGNRNRRPIVEHQHRPSPQEKPPKEDTRPELQAKPSDSKEKSKKGPKKFTRAKSDQHSHATKTNK